MHPTLSIKSEVAVASTGALPGQDARPRLPPPSPIHWRHGSPFDLAVSSYSGESQDSPPRISAPRSKTHGHHTGPPPSEPPPERPCCTYRADSSRSTSCSYLLTSRSPVCDSTQPSQQQQRHACERCKPRDQPPIPPNGPPSPALADMANANA